MKEDFSDLVPCSSLAVDSVLRMSSAGLLWGCCFGPFDARRQGLSGSTRASFIAKSVGKYGFSCGLFAAIFSFTQCGIQRYRRKKDWLIQDIYHLERGKKLRVVDFRAGFVNTLAAGVVAGAAFGARTRDWKQVAGLTGLFCTFFQFAKDSKSV